MSIKGKPPVKFVLHESNFTGGLLLYMSRIIYIKKEFISFFIPRIISKKLVCLCIIFLIFRMNYIFIKTKT